MVPATSTLDRRSASVIVIDVQDRLAAAMPQRERVISSASLLLRAAGIVGVPVIVTRQYPKGLGDTDAALGAVLSEATDAGADISTVDKMTFDCFAEPSFVEAVRASARRQLVIAGMETHICVTQTALAALREGFDVHVIADACCSREEASHGYALARLTAAGAVISTAESAAYELVGRAGTDEFRALLAAVKG